MILVRFSNQFLWLLLYFNSKFELFTFVCHVSYKFFILQSPDDIKKNTFPTPLKPQVKNVGHVANWYDVFFHEHVGCVCVCVFYFLIKYCSTFISFTILAMFYLVFFCVVVVIIFDVEHRKTFYICVSSRRAIVKMKSQSDTELT